MNLNIFIIRLGILSLVTLSAIHGRAQNFPVLKAQVDLGAVQELSSSARQNTFLAKSLSGHTLIDQRSKLQLGTLKINSEPYGLPGWGKTLPWGDSGFLFSTGSELLLADVVSGSIDTLFKAIKFPEFIVEYREWPYQEGILIIATKTYPVDKKGMVNFLKPNKDGQSVYDDTKIGRLLLFDCRSRTVQKSVDLPHAITVFADDQNSENILAGTFEGNILSISQDLSVNIITHAFNFPVHSLLRQDNFIISVPHFADKFIGTYGDGEIVLIDQATKEKKKLKLPEQQEIRPNDGGLTVTPHNHIKRIFSFPHENALLVNYGFRGLLKVKIPSLDTSSYPAPVVNEISYYSFNRDSTQLMAVTSDHSNIFGSSGELQAYDLDRRKFQYTMKKPMARIAYKSLYKMFDAEGNYHFLGVSNTRPDTIAVYSSNKTNPTILTSNYQFSVDPVDTAILLSGSKGIYGKIHLERLMKDHYHFEVDYNGKADTLQDEIFEVILDTRKLPRDLIPYGISGVHQLKEGKKLLAGNYPSGKSTLYWIRVLDASNKIIFALPDFQKAGFNEFYKLSPSREKLVIFSEVNKESRLEAWDIGSGKKIFTKSTLNANKLFYFDFDRRKDVLVYSLVPPNEPTSIYQADLRSSSPKESLLFSGNGFLSFKIDLEKDLIASENYSSLHLHRISDRKPLWSKEPSSDFFKTFFQPSGFGFSSESEYHQVGENLSYLYFTSYEGHAPIETYNDYLYRGDKSSVNNLAFVLNRKAYLPGDYDMYFNRPDSVLINSGSDNTLFHKLVTKAVEKRQRRHGVKKLDQVLSQSPSFSIDGISTIPETVKSSSMVINVKAETLNGQPVESIHVIDNGVPLFGASGLATNSRREIAVPIALVNGRNELKLFAMDNAGNISASENIALSAEFETVKPKTFFIGIGIDKFKSGTNGLNYSVKDIRDLAAKLKEKLGEEISIDTLFNENVTAENIGALKNRLLQGNTNDRVIIAYSGHGLLDEAKDYYLSTYNINFEKPKEGGLAYEKLENLVDAIPARKRLVLIDACHSGEVDKEEMVKYEKVIAANASTGLKGVGTEVWDNPKAGGLKNSFELMQELFMNVGNATGATIISAAAGTQLAQESGDLKNGVFTFSILEFMKANEACLISDLKQYVNTRVPELTNGLQVPTTRMEVTGEDWGLW